MMNLNPLFFDKSIFAGNTNFLGSSDNSNKTYLFSDIIKICEEELDANQQNINASEKEILLDVNDLKNLTITKSNKETVEGIQQVIELLGNISLISNSSAVKINSAQITSKIFILDKESLELFFNKINESLKQKDFTNTGKLQDAKIVFLNQRELKSNNTDLTNSIGYDFIGFNPDAIIKSIDNKDIFSIALKTNGEKLTLTISSTEPSNEIKNKFSKKLLENKSQDEFIASNKYSSNNEILNNLYELGNANRNELENQNSILENQSENYPEKAYYKLEVIHTSFENNNLIYSPDKDIQTSVFEENNLFTEKNKLVDSNEEVDSSKIAGVINPVKRNGSLNSVKPDKTDKENIAVNFEKNTSAIIVNEIKDDFNDNSIDRQKDFNKELENTFDKSTQIFNKDNYNRESINPRPSINSEIDFNLLTGGTFTKVKVIKDAAGKNITRFNPEVIDNQSKEIDNKDKSQIKNEFEREVNELNIESIKVEVKKAEQKLDINTTANLTDKSDSKEIYNNQISDYAETLKEVHPEKLIESFSKSSLKSFINENKKNQISDTSYKIKSVNSNKSDESKKVDINTNPSQINLNQKTNGNEILDYQSLRVNEINLNQSANSSETNIDKDNKDEKGTKKSLQKQESIPAEFEKNINKSEQIAAKENTKNLQVNAHENSNSKIEINDNQLNVLKNRIQNEFSNLKESLKIINANQITDEISKYINRGNKQNITFQLSPESLGKLTLSIDYIENQLCANIEVENEQVKQLIQNNIEQLKSSLQSTGIQLNDINVSLSSYEQKSLRNSYAKKKSYSKNVYGKEIKVESSKTSSTKKMMGYNTYDYLI